jgi:hypothetical protein
MGDFIEHFGLTPVGRTEQIIELIEKFEKLLGRPVEVTEFRNLIKATYAQADESMMQKISQGLTQARKIDLQVITLKELQKTSGIRLPERLFIAELEKKTQRTLAGLKGTYIPGTNAKIEWIKKEREKIQMGKGAPSFFIIKAKKEASLEAFRKFWREN